MSAVIILVDQDSVLADWETGFLLAWRSKFPNETFVPLELRRSVKIADDYPEHLRKQIKSITRTSGFYRNLLPLPGGKEAVKKLLELGHDVRICTSPLSDYENCVLEKYE